MRVNKEGRVGTFSALKHTHTQLSEQQKSQIEDSVEKEFSKVSY